MSAGTLSLPIGARLLRRSPVWGKTDVFEAASGKKQMTGYWTSPVYRYGYRIFARETNGNEIAALLSLFNGCRGRWDSFRFTDPYDALLRDCQWDQDEMDCDWFASGMWEIQDIYFTSLK